MKNKIISLVLVAGLAACSGGNPFDDPTDTDPSTGDGGTTDGGETDGDGITTDGLPPGTLSPTPSSGIFRSEVLDSDASSATLGNGFARAISYNSADDTFTVDNLAFDGDSPYTRGAAVSSLNNGAFAVYEAPTLANDPVTGQPIDQFSYRAIYGVSKNRVADANGDATTQAATQFAIVRTGNYIPYGFGGFIYQRDDGVTLPTQLQASFTGKSAGLRDFKGTGGLQYSTGNVRIDIDTDDFNDGAGVRGTVSNRRVLDLAGNDITAAVANSITPGLSTIPDARFVVGPGVLSENGDLTGELISQFVDEDGNAAEYETGNYYAIVSGDDPDEIVGVFVLENNIENSNAGVRDTSGFIVYRETSTTSP